MCKKSHPLPAGVKSEKYIKLLRDLGTPLFLPVINVRAGMNPQIISIISPYLHGGNYYFGQFVQSLNLFQGQIFVESAFLEIEILKV